MHKNNRFGKLVFYIEACHSGSMFNTLEHDWNTFATTAASMAEDSYACNYDKFLGTFLGDTYSVRWLEGKFASGVFDRLL